MNFSVAWLQHPRESPDQGLHLTSVNKWQAEWHETAESETSERQLFSSFSQFSTSFLSLSMRSTPVPYKDFSSVTAAFVSRCSVSSSSHFDDSKVYYFLGNPEGMYIQIVELWLLSATWKRSDVISWCRNSFTEFYCCNLIFLNKDSLFKQTIIIIIIIIIKWQVYGLEARWLHLVGKHNTYK